MLSASRKQGLSGSHQFKMPLYEDEDVCDSVTVAKTSGSQVQVRTKRYRDIVRAPYALDGVQWRRVNQSNSPVGKCVALPPHSLESLEMGFLSLLVDDTYDLSALPVRSHFPVLTPDADQSHRDDLGALAAGDVVLVTVGLFPAVGSVEGDIWPSLSDLRPLSQDCVPAGILPLVLPFVVDSADQSSLGAVTLDVSPYEMGYYQVGVSSDLPCLLDLPDSDYPKTLVTGVDTGAWTVPEFITACWNHAHSLKVSGSHTTFLFFPTRAGPLDVVQSSIHGAPFSGMGEDKGIWDSSAPISRNEHNGKGVHSLMNAIHKDMNSPEHRIVLIYHNIGEDNYRPVVGIRRMPHGLPLLTTPMVCRHKRLCYRKGTENATIPWIHRVAGPVVCPSGLLQTGHVSARMPYDFTKTHNRNFNRDCAADFLSASLPPIQGYSEVDLDGSLGSFAHHAGEKGSSLASRLRQEDTFLEYKGVGPIQFEDDTSWLIDVYKALLPVLPGTLCGLLNTSILTGRETCIGIGVEEHGKGSKNLSVPLSLERLHPSLLAVMVTYFFAGVYDRLPGAMDISIEREQHLCLRPALNIDSPLYSELVRMTVHNDGTGAYLQVSIDTTRALRPDGSEQARLPLFHTCRPTDVPLHQSPHLCLQDDGAGSHRIQRMDNSLLQRTVSTNMVTWAPAAPSKRVVVLVGTEPGAFKAYCMELALQRPSPDHRAVVSAVVGAPGADMEDPHDLPFLPLIRMTELGPTGFGCRHIQLFRCESASDTLEAKKLRAVVSKCFQVFGECRFVCLGFGEGSAPISSPHTVVSDTESGRCIPWVLIEPRRPLLARGQPVTYGADLSVALERSGVTLMSTGGLVPTSIDAKHAINSLRGGQEDPGLVCAVLSSVTPESGDSTPSGLVPSCLGDMTLEREVGRLQKEMFLVGVVMDPRVADTVSADSLNQVVAAAQGLVRKHCFRGIALVLRGESKLRLSGMTSLFRCPVVHVAVPYFQTSTYHKASSLSFAIRAIHGYRTLDAPEMFPDLRHVLELENVTVWDSIHSAMSGKTDDVAVCAKMLVDVLGAAGRRALCQSCWYCILGANIEVKLDETLLTTLTGSDICRHSPTRLLGRDLDCGTLGIENPYYAAVILGVVHSEDWRCGGDRTRAIDPCHASLRHVMTDERFLRFLSQGYLCDSTASDLCGRTEGPREGFYYLDVLDTFLEAVVTLNHMTPTLMTAIQLCAKDLRRHSESSLLRASFDQVMFARVITNLNTCIESAREDMCGEQVSLCHVSLMILTKYLKDNMRRDPHAYLPYESAIVSQLKVMLSSSPYSAALGVDAAVFILESLEVGSPPASPIPQALQPIMREALLVSQALTGRGHHIYHLQKHFPSLKPSACLVGCLDGTRNTVRRTDLKSIQFDSTIAHYPVCLASSKSLHQAAILMKLRHEWVLPDTVTSDINIRSALENNLGHDRRRPLAWGVSHDCVYPLILRQVREGEGQMAQVLGNDAVKRLRYDARCNPSDEVKCTVEGYTVVWCQFGDGSRFQALNGYDARDPSAQGTTAPCQCAIVYIPGVTVPIAVIGPQSSA
ncbi:hypothetical protein KIPB_000280 [Kipferlia bialata]|uniref:Uncharacterized protein n=1 Tax=Kipferlia bialata TaxID=797122 RepID=A0A391NZL8_9EUKA|nr:hypothetical protein KIPB_000280 [Kipferlia bialata]|eukprot:g280.t1